MFLKIIENAMLYRLFDYLEISKLYDGQYGFRKSSAAISGVLDVVTQFQFDIDSDKQCDSLSFDHKKAFDIVD